MVLRLTRPRRLASVTVRLDSPVLLALCELTAVRIGGLLHSTANLVVNRYQVYYSDITINGNGPLPNSPHQVLGYIESGLLPEN